ncbi:ABC transporter permease [Leucobacter weissii]|uniref:Transport permease protein n=1 Tax=Leucobacter weissii TaxID=1983706 RepID=A0A939MQI8_9MICO|nr:ABC transporter permease [Leucobacter weissii]MBO1902766.1 ABC transporter permease [Leucobacter weissii]
MSATTRPDSSLGRGTDRGAPPVGVLTAAVSAIRFELMAYFRTPDTVFFTFLFPVLMLGIFGTAFASMDEVGVRPDGTGGITMAAYYLPGMVASAILLSGLQNLAIDIAREKSEGWLRRLGSTPLSPVSYFFGKAGAILVTTAAQLVLLFAFAVLVFGVELPREPELWLRFAWIALLGIVTMTLLGIALSALPRSSRSATAVVLPIVLLLQFISGVYLMFSMLPDWLQSIAALFPLKWLAQGMRSVFLPDHLAVLESGEVWDLGLVALNLGIWLVVGLVASLLTFRWVRRS